MWWGVSMRGCLQINFGHACERFTFIVGINTVSKAKPTCLTVWQFHSLALGPGIHENRDERRNRYSVFISLCSWLWMRKFITICKAADLFFVSSFVGSEFWFFCPVPLNLLACFYKKPFCNFSSILSRIYNKINNGQSVAWLVLLRAIFYSNYSDFYWRLFLLKTEEYPIKIFLL